MTAIEGEYRLRDLLDAVESLLGVLPPVLRVDQRRSDAAGEPTLVVVDLESPGATPPDGFTWTSWRGIGVGARSPKEARDALPRWIERRERGPTPLDPPWAIPGWSARAAAWMEDRLRDAGHPVTSPPRLVYSWGISVILCAPTAAGKHYLKCSAPIFAAEAILTSALAGITPELVTRVVAAEKAEGWLLMADHGDRVLGEQPARTWAGGLDALATIQRAWRGRTAELVAAGAPVRSVAALGDLLPGLADSEPLRSELGADLEVWNAAMPRFVAACGRLAELGPAPTLVHGDFHPWNVAVTDDRPLVFDWSDTAISHPFVDLAVYLTRTDDVAVRRDLRDAYLARWRDGIPAGELAEAAEVALLVGTLYQVECYARLLGSLEPEDRGGMNGAAGSWARAALDVLEHGIATQRPGHADG
ncbi:MAG: aminoglycoside phosphotransferase family protein [Thermoleophilaceae bacterium]|nr:aminoglycoside phosphotransferase family protein [Thermoleophilaceae bacterium]